MERCVARGRAVALAAAAALAITCSSAEPVRPSSLSIVSGDAQTGPVNRGLRDSLVVTVTGSDGRVFQGGNVTWLVATGSASVSPQASVSDASGRAATKVWLGAAAGAITITATVGGVSPATYHLTSVSACDWREPYTFAATITAELDARDCVFPDGSFIDYYGFSVSARGSARFRLVSSAFDAFLFLFDGTNMPVGGNDDDGTSLNSAVRIIMASGSYVLGANSYAAGQTGLYAMMSEAFAEDIGSCAVWFVTRGVQTDQQLAATDCVASGYYSDLVAIYLPAGRTATITQNSTALDAYLTLFDAFGTTVASDDNGGGGTNARIAYTPATSTFYIISAGSFLAGATGAYTLAISAPVAAGVAGASRDPVATTLRQLRESWPNLASGAVPRPPKVRR